LKPDAVVFLQAVTATAAWISGLLFLRFWRDTREPLFVHFGISFWLLALSWALLGLLNPTGETRSSIYLLRLLAFVVIIIGIVQRNRAR
jgi:hypothetical protein